MRKDLPLSGPYFQLWLIKMRHWASSPWSEQCLLVQGPRWGDTSLQVSICATVKINELFTKLRRKEGKSLTQSAVVTSTKIWRVFGTSSGSTQLTLNCDDRRSGQTGATHGNGREEPWTQILTELVSAVAGPLSSTLGAAVIPEASPFGFFEATSDTSVEPTKVLSIATVEPAAGAVVMSRDTAMVKASVGTNGRDRSQRPAWLPHLSFNDVKSATFTGVIVSTLTVPLTRACSRWCICNICFCIILTHHIVCTEGECDEKQTERDIWSTWCLRRCAVLTLLIIHIRMDEQSWAGSGESKTVLHLHHHLCCTNATCNTGLVLKSLGLQCVSHYLHPDVA